MAQAGKFLNVQFGNIDFFVFLQDKLSQLGMSQLWSLDCNGTKF